MYSDIVKKGLEKTPHRSLFKASGFTDEEIAAFERYHIKILDNINRKRSDK